MIKPDLIVVWPIAYDYPIFRELIADNRNLFGKVIISFAHNCVERDYRQFLKNTHTDFTFVESMADKHWYDDAISIALDEVKSKWVMFMEQDFVCDRKFLVELLKKASDYHFVSLREDQRFHFGCFVAKMKYIKATHRYFGHIPDAHLDCFGLFVAELILMSMGKYAALGELKLEGYKHLSGLTHNYTLMSDGEPAVGGAEALASLKEYNERCIHAKVLQNTQWIELLKKFNSTL